MAEKKGISPRYTINGKEDNVMEGVIGDLNGDSLNRFNNIIGDWKAIAIFQSSKYYDWDGGNTSASNHYYTIVAVDDVQVAKLINIDEIKEVRNFRSIERVDISSETLDINKMFPRELNNKLKGRHKTRKKRWPNSIYHIPSGKAITISSDVLSVEPITTIDWKVLKGKVGPISGEKKKLLQELIRAYPDPVCIREHSSRWYRTGSLRNHDIIDGKKVNSSLINFTLTALGVGFVNNFMDAGLTTKKDAIELVCGIRFLESFIERR